jgi:anti-sigma B factor antagonist
MMTQADTPKVEENGTVRVITLTSGKLLEEENALASELEGRTDGLGGHLLLDFSRVERISSVELGTLITLHKRLTAAGGRLTLFHLSPQVYEVFSITRLDTLLCICREKASEPP